MARGRADRYRAGTAIPLAAVTAAIVASVLNSLIALGATSLGAPATGGLTTASYVSLTVIAAVAGSLGWHLIARRTRRPRSVMRWLVPTFVLVSFVPDILVGLAMGWLFAGALMLMHLATAATSVATYSQLMPLPRTDRTETATGDHA